MRRTFALLALAMLLPALPIFAVERGVKRVESFATAGRHALVIGNSAYTHTSPLRNPVNDARAMTDSLQSLGFMVVTVIDSDQRGMDQAIRQFGKTLRNEGGVGLFYYAGHGMQIDGENFLLPVDIDPSTEADVHYDAVPVGKLLGQMEAAGNPHVHRTPGSPAPRCRRWRRCGGLSSVAWLSGPVAVCSSGG